MQPTEQVICLSCGSEMVLTFPRRFRCPKCNGSWSDLDSWEGAPQVPSDDDG